MFLDGCADHLREDARFAPLSAHDEDPNYAAGNRPFDATLKKLLSFR
jgi:hypothetical protein